MIQLKRHELNFALALKYFQWNLTDVNALSSSLINMISFENGKFFTLLSNESNLKQIDDFRCGGVTGNIRNQISFVILDYLQKNKSLSCVFDDATATFKPGYKETLFSSCGLSYEKEVYYLVNQANVSIELIRDCFRASNAIWHSLCVLSEVILEKEIKKNLTLKQIEEVCKKSRLIVLGAYDGEGYVFWERNC